MSHFELNRFFGNCEVGVDSEIKKRAESLFITAQQLWQRPSEVLEEEPAVQRSTAANFHADCIRLAQKHLGVVLSEVSQTRYEAGDRDTDSSARSQQNITRMEVSPTFGLACVAVKWNSWNKCLPRGSARVADRLNRPCYCLF